jgi:hypothetical protein
MKIDCTDHRDPDTIISARSNSKARQGKARPPYAGMATILDNSTVYHINIDII